MLTAECLREMLHYDPETGVFTWKIAYWRNVVGSTAGNVKADGYVYLNLLGRRYLAHRLAVFYMTGEFPPAGMETDHRDRDRSNNRWSNLRVATVSQNRANSRRRTGKATEKGVRLAPHGRFQARIIHNGEEIYLGSFATEAEAHAVYMTAARDLHGEFARAG